MKPRQKELKQKIETLEYYTNGLNRINGGDVSAENIRIEGNKVFADVTLIQEGHREIFDNVEYPLQTLKKVKIWKLKISFG